MTIEQLLGALRRRKLLFLATFILCMGAAVAVTTALPKTYRAKAVLAVAEAEAVDALDSATIEQLTRTYATLAANPNVVEAVRDQLGRQLSRSKLLEKMSFTPVERTQLLEIAADDTDPATAQVIARVYAETFERRANAQAGSGRTLGRVAISEPPARPTSPIKPNPPLYLGFGALLAFGLALGAVVLRETLDKRIVVDEEKDTVLDLPVLGRIPIGSPARARRRERDLIFDDAFRLLKTNIDFAGEGANSVVLVTSPGPIEGKTSVAANLALASVAEGQRLALIEGDLRRPALEASTGWHDFDRPPDGLTNYLVGGLELAEVITSHPQIPGLDVIWSGPVVKEPSALLNTGRLAQLLTMLRGQYDRVILDSPPVSIGADTLVLAGQADGVVYVIDTRRTKRPAAQTGLNQLRKSHVDILGVVLNRIATPFYEGYYYSREALDLPASAPSVAAAPEHSRDVSERLERER
jgi:capsular exopolysaccharide synthesis family protein